MHQTSCYKLNYLHFDTGKVDDELGEWLSRNDDKVSVKETDEELLVRALRIFVGVRDKDPEAVTGWSNDDWVKNIKHLIGPMISSHHALRDAMMVPDVALFFLDILPSGHFNGSKVLSPRFAKTALMNVHGKVSADAPLRQNR